MRKRTHDPQREEGEAVAAAIRGIAGEAIARALAELGAADDPDLWRRPHEAAGVALATFRTLLVMSANRGNWHPEQRLALCLAAWGWGRANRGQHFLAQFGEALGEWLTARTGQRVAVAIDHTAAWAVAERAQQEIAAGIAAGRVPT